MRGYWHDGHDNNGDGGWDGAGNAFHEPQTQPDGRVYINLPKWSVVMLRLL
jgi:1,4-alpha-glucan branching enzyme